MGTMMRYTSLAMGISASELRDHQDRYDRACKRLLSEKEVLGWILHECLNEFKNVSPAEIASNYIDGNPEVGIAPVNADDAAASLVTGIGTEDSSIDEGTVWYDIRFRALVPGTDELVGMIVNVEAQGDFYPGYPLLKRAMYYCGRMISSQYGHVFTNSRYEKLQKVCSIWICPNPPVEFRNTITRFAMAEEQLVGTASLDKAEYDLIEMILACPDGDNQQKGDGLLRLLGTLLASEKSADERKSIISNEFGIAMSERFSDEVNEMSNVSKGLEEMWYRQGVDKGFREGERAGYDRGEREGYDRGEQAGYEKGEQAGYEKGEREGYNKGERMGYDKGEARTYELLSLLASRLSEAGRADEMSAALLDRQLLDKLLDEFNLGTEE